MAKKAFQRGELIDEWTNGSCRVKVFDGALVARTKDNPSVKSIMDRIALLGIRVSEELHEDGS